MPSDVQSSDHDVDMEGGQTQRVLTLEDEIQEALSQEILSFTGNYYHAQLQRSAPNPCLSISGLGTLGLPLENDSARRIISGASPMREGFGTLHKPVRGIWEVDAARISFLNPAWDSYISDALCPEVCTALGASTSAPKMELCKLLLCEEGANHPPNQDPQAADRVFATVTLLLPSAYSGGATVLSHASNSKTIDFSPASVYSSAVLAWYIDVTHEVQSITSGYRLALSYNLVHTTTPTEPCPSSPKTLEATDLLRCMLRKWRDKLDNKETEQNRMVCLLEHTYDPDFKDMPVIPSLKGVDAHRVRIIHDIAEELGFTLGVASLDYKYGPITEVIKESNYVTRLTGLDGKPLLGLSRGLSLYKNTIVIVPGTKTDCTASAKCDDNPHQSGRRTMLLIIDKQRQDDFRLIVDGLPVAIHLLQGAFKNSREGEIMKWAWAVLRRANSSEGEFTDKIFLDIFNHALERRDLQLWLETTRHSKWNFRHMNTELVFKAYNTFSFEDVCERFSHLVDSTIYIQDSSSPLTVNVIIFLHTLSSGVAKDDEREMVKQWCEEAVRHILEWLWPSKDAQGAEIVIQVIKLVGMELSRKSLIPQLIRWRDAEFFDFWATLHKLLRDQRQDLLESFSKSHPESFVPSGGGCITVTKTDSQDTQVPTAEVLDEFIAISLLISSSTWSKVPHLCWSDVYHRRPRPPFNPNLEKLKRLLLVLEACVRSNNTQACEIALEKALEMSGNPIWNFSDFYIPVVIRLRQVLLPLNQDLSHPLFSKFIQKLVGRYLSNVLGKRGPVVDIGLRKITCETSVCATCNSLDAFILSTQSEIQLPVDPEDCYHAEERLETVIDLCTYGRLGNVNWDDPLSYFTRTTLEIKKHESVVHCSNWDYRLASTKSFLESIGPDSVIEEIMGERYADLQHALAGRRKFVWDEKRNARALLTPPNISHLTEGSPIFPRDDADTVRSLSLSCKRKRA